MATREKNVPPHTVRLTRDNKDVKLVITAGSRKEARWLFDGLSKDLKQSRSGAISIDSATRVKSGVRQAVVTT